MQRNMEQIIKIQQSPVRLADFEVSVNIPQNLPPFEELALRGMALFYEIDLLSQVTLNGAR